MVIVKCKRLDDEAQIPVRGSEYSAGLDLCAVLKNGARAQRIPAGKTAKIGTGIAMEIPEGYFGAVFARSGMATNRGLRPSNCVGVIDSDYRGEIIVALQKKKKKCETIHHGDRIAQLVIVPYFPVQLDEADELESTVRGEGGFGSTGTK